MTFYEWLMKQNTLKNGQFRDTRFGDLAADIARDENFPQDGRLKQIHEHLESKYTSQAAMDTFRRAWLNYRKWLRNNTGITFE